MYIDPGDELTRLWDRDILDKQEAASMWNFFTDSLACLLDLDSINHLIENQGHLIRMYFYFALMSVTPLSLGESIRYMVGVNNEEYLLRNIHCIQKFNANLTYRRVENVIYMDPLPINFRIDSYSDHRTYQVPSVLGGSNYAYSIFADDI